MNKQKVIGMFFISIVSISCATTGITSTNSKSWTYNKAPKRTLKLGSIQIDKTASYSVEHEVAVLLPLLFLENRMVFPATDEDGEADFIVDVHAAERDYPAGWETRKSLSMELYIRRNRENRPEKPEEAAENGDSSTPRMKEPPGANTGFTVVTPDAAARIRAAGKLGFSSSKNLEYLLRLCVQKAAAQLRRSRSWKQK